MGEKLEKLGYLVMIKLINQAKTFLYLSWANKIFKYK